MTLFFPPRFNLGVLEKARLDIFKAESHAFRTHDSLKWEHPPNCFLTLISQTESGLWKPSWEATKASGSWSRNLWHAFFWLFFFLLPLSAHHSQSECQHCLHIQPIVLPLLAGVGALSLSLCSWPGLASQKYTSQNVPVTHLSPPWNRIPFLLCIRSTPVGRWDRHRAEGEF